MVGLIMSEFRKVLSTKMWWGLMIPAALIALGFTWLGAAFGTLDALKSDIGGSLPTVLPTFAFGLNFASIFPAVYGATALTGEIRHRTITTTYLTGSSRGAVLVSKVAAYAGVGVLYGLACAVFGTIGAAAGAHGADFPGVGAWLAMCGVGVLVMVLWTLLGVGLGALIGSQIGTVLTLLLYTLLVERILATVLGRQHLDNVPPYLPNAAGSNATTELSLRLFFDDMPEAVRSHANFQQLKDLLALSNTPPWWGSALVFACYALVIGLLGWAVARERDIT
jgi:ABC-2 type transport system permease protein